MNLDLLKKNVSQRVQLLPVAYRLDENGRELEPMDDDWIFGDVSNDTLRISNVRTGHVATLGKDHVHHFTTNPHRSEQGVKHGFLTLNVQIFLQGDNLWVRPNARPGERVNPDGMSDENRIQRARLLDQRFEMVTKDYARRGTPQPMIDSFLDLSQAEKAELFDRAVQWKHGRPPSKNPYREE